MRTPTTTPLSILDLVTYAEGATPAEAIRNSRTLARKAEEGGFGVAMAELESYFAPAAAGGKVRAIPGEGLDVPIWILGSSLYSARLAARLGRPYAFASHFAPGDLLEALAVYRAQFRPSRH